MNEMLRCWDSKILRDTDSKMLGFLPALSSFEAEDKALDRRSSGCTWVGSVSQHPGPLGRGERLDSCVEPSTYCLCSSL